MNYKLVKVHKQKSTKFPLHNISVFIDEHCLQKASLVARVVKNLPANAEGIRDIGSIPGLGRSPGEGNGNPLQCFCLKNPVDRGA